MNRVIVYHSNRVGVFNCSSGLGVYLVRPEVHYQITTSVQSLLGMLVFGEPQLVVLLLGGMDSTTMENVNKWILQKNPQAVVCYFPEKNSNCVVPPGVQRIDRGRAKETAYCWMADRIDRFRMVHP